MMKFTELNKLLDDKASLAVHIHRQLNGQLQVLVVPNGEFKVEALRTPLSLTGTPEELDDAFVGAIEAYQVARIGLMEQVRATTDALEKARMEQASKASANKGTPQNPASAVGKKPASSATGVAGMLDDDEGDDLDEASAVNGNESDASPAPVELSLF